MTQHWKRFSLDVFRVGRLFKKHGARDGIINVASQREILPFLIPRRLYSLKTGKLIRNVHSFLPWSFFARRSRIFEAERSVFAEKFSSVESSLLFRSRRSNRSPWTSEIIILFRLTTEKQKVENSRRDHIRGNSIIPSFYNKLIRAVNVFRCSVMSLVKDSFRGRREREQARWRANGDDDDERRGMHAGRRATCEILTEQARVTTIAS